MRSQSININANHSMTIEQEGSPSSVGIDRRIRLEAGKHLREHAPIRSALHYFKDHPEALKVRTGELSDATERLASIMGVSIFEKPEIDTGKYLNVAALRDDLDRSPMTLEYFVSFVNAAGNSKFMQEDIASTFQKIDERIKTGAWEFPTHLHGDPEQLASALLVMSYPQAIRGLGKNPRFADERFVYALEEVLFNDYPNASLTKDIIGFMKAEKDSFSLQLAAELDKMPGETTLDLHLWDGLEEFAEPEDPKNKKTLERKSQNLGVTSIQLAKLEFAMFGIGDRGPVWDARWHKRAKLIAEEIGDDDKVKKFIQWYTRLKFAKRKSLDAVFAELPLLLRAQQQQAVREVTNVLQGTFSNATIIDSSAPDRMIEE